MKKLRVGILGATGAVGQQFLSLLENHPWFQVTAIAASERSVGKTFREAAKWQLETAMPDWLGEKTVQACEPDLECDFVFSGLDSSVAEKIEWNFAKNGMPVISNSKNHRHDPLIPLLIPEINYDHLKLIQEQQKKYGFGDGFIVTNPNCSTVGLALAIFPLWQKIGIESIIVTTLQAISGAGFTGLPSMNIMGNVIPNITGEVAKIQQEPLKIFGEFDNNQIKLAEINISAQCNRVPVRYGHLISVSLKLKRFVDLEEIRSIYYDFRSPIEELNLPGAHQKPVLLANDFFRPQPILDLNQKNGMIVTVGQLQKCSVLDVRFVGLVHNTIRGAAGGAILNGELLVEKGIIRN